MNENGGKRRGLGRGLDALLGGDANIGATDQDTHHSGREAAGGILRLPVGDIRPGKFQPRRTFDDGALEELKASIEEKGVLQPILVRRHPDEAGCWELIAGERRWLAAQRAQLHEIPAVVHDLSDRETLEVGLVENVQRTDLNPLEEAEGYSRLIADFHYTQEALSKIVGKSRSHVANMLRLLKLNDGARKLLDSGALSAGHGRALLAAADPDDLAAKIVREGLSVRQAERLAQGRGRGRSGAAAGRGGGRTGKDADTVALERALEERLGLKVVIDHKDTGGQISIRYNSLEQLDDLLARLLEKP
ncbi:MAG: ParB/RepB/Spo0J family partition protein [Rhodospirillaceae bacterium]|nr:ParB/RepB/Spo0J family partition protein [Rhodospirillaceae bacterium]